MPPTTSRAITHSDHTHCNLIVSIVLEYFINNAGPAAQNLLIVENGRAEPILIDMVPRRVIEI